MKYMFRVSWSNKWVKVDGNSLEHATHLFMQDHVISNSVPDKNVRDKDEM